MTVYEIIENSDVLDARFELADAERMLCYYLNREHGAYLRSHDTITLFCNTLSCGTGCASEHSIKPYFDGDTFSHFYCGYCGDTYQHPLNTIS